MNAQVSTALYTPQLLALAVTLADYRYDPEAENTAEARSAVCGSKVAFSCNRGPAANVQQPGLHVIACAVGQAAAAVFAASAAGRSRSEIADARDAIEGWLSGGGALPDWPGFSVLEPVLRHPGRHGAMPLAWNAALAALSKDTSGR